MFTVALPPTQRTNRFSPFFWQTTAMSTITTSSPSSITTSSPSSIKRRASTQADPDVFDNATTSATSSSIKPTPTQIKEACAMLLTQCTTQYDKILPEHDRLEEQKTALEQQLSPVKAMFNATRVAMVRIEWVLGIMSKLIQGHYVVVYDFERTCTLLNDVFEATKIGNDAPHYHWPNMLCHEPLSVPLPVRFTFGGYKWREVTDVELYIDSLDELILEQMQACGKFPASAEIEVDATESEIKVDDIKPNRGFDIDLSEAGYGVKKIQNHKFEFSVVYLEGIAAMLQKQQ
jgi:hypothetical protein